MLSSNCSIGTHNQQVNFFLLLCLYDKRAHKFALHVFFLKKVIKNFCLIKKNAVGKNIYLRVKHFIAALCQFVIETITKILPTKQILR